MKGLTSLVAALVALALVGTASADTIVVRLTGSSAFRPSTHAAIAHLFGAVGAAPYTLAGDAVYGYSGGTSIANSDQAIFIGTLGADTVIIKTSWSGSTGGINTVSNSLSVNFLADSTPGLTNTGLGGLTAGAVGEIPDIAMADSFQSSTPFVANLLEQAILGPVGVVPFKWVAGTDAPAGLTNMTPQLAQALFGAGEASLALFTGNNADESAKVFAIGRDPDSGTRLCAFAETGLGANATVVQWHPTFTGTAVTSQALEAPTTINGIPIALGNGGYSSGGSLAKALRYTTTAIGGTYVTYLSTGDAATALSPTGVGAGAGKELTYNGVPYSLTAVQEGSYTFWCYEHLLYRNDLIEAKKTLANAIADQIRDFDATVLLSTMKVSRQTDGGTITSDLE